MDFNKAALEMHETHHGKVGIVSKVEVNGSAQGGGILYPTYPKSLLSYPYAVPEDSVFILGDCRTQAEDSRDFGPVQCSAVKAKVITLIRRRGL